MFLMLLIASDECLVNVMFLKSNMALVQWACNVTLGINCILPFLQNHEVSRLPTVKS